MIHKTQKITSYISGYGLTIYEIMQYNKDVNDWYIVGNSSENKELIENQIELHNYKLSINTHN